jgi:hypothetical protein
MAAADISKSVVHILEQLVLTANIQGVTTYTAAVDAPSLTTGLVDSVDVTVTGVSVGDIVLGVVTADNTALSADVHIIGAYVTAANVVRVTLFNTTGGTLDATSESHEFIVLERT